MTSHLRIVVLLSDRSKNVGKPADWVRIVMNRETEKWLLDLDTGNMDALEISGHKWQRFDFGSYRNTRFPDLDICSEVPEGEFDIIIAEQVWEHLKYPYRATRNVLKALRPGGYFLVTLPFLIRQHCDPIDCSRWTATGLRYFLEECGFDSSSIRVDQWGNREALIANLDSWVRFDAERHALNNEERFPVSVWGLARKLQ